MITLLSYALFCLAFAYWNARRIEQDMPINHDRNAMLHGIWYGVAIFVNLFTHEWLLMLAMPFVGRLFFDTALNLFRGLNIGYVSPWLFSESPAIRKKVSKIDRWEYAVFKSGVLPKVVYLLILITLIFINYV